MDSISATERHHAAHLTIGEIAERAGVAVSAVRFYEKHGLIASERSSGNQRRFTASAACRIQVARVAQRIGLSVREITGILADLPDDARPQDWDEITASLIEEAEARLAELRATLDDLGSGEKLCALDPVDRHPEKSSADSMGRSSLRR